MREVAIQNLSSRKKQFSLPKRLIDDYYKITFIF